MTCAMVWPCAAPVTRVRRISISSVPWTISPFACRLSAMYLQPRLPLECLPLERLWEESIHHSNVYGKEFLTSPLPPTCCHPEARAFCGPKDLCNLPAAPHQRQIA